MGGDFRARNKLRAAVTATGAALWLTSTGVMTRDTANASHNDATLLETRKSLSAMASVQQLNQDFGHASACAV